MSNESSTQLDWRALWASGDLGRFCFISLGILLHASNETMVATIMPAMVHDISGVQLVGWSLAIYELGSIVAGAAAGRLTSYISIRTNMAGAAFLYAVGALICATAPDMPWFLAGRLIEGLGGGALLSLAYVSVERLFPREIWPRLFAITSVVWGVGTFGGPLLGALMSEASSWRWAFGAFVAGGLVMAAVSYVVLSTPQAAQVVPSVKRPAFPFATLAVLGAGIILIALAGVDIEPARSIVLLALGLAGLVLFFALDGWRPAARLFPSRPFDWRSPTGTGLVMFAAFSTATCVFSLYGPLVLTKLHGISILTTGYIIAAESIAWSALSIIVANLSIKSDARLIATGGVMIAAGASGLAIAVPIGSIPFVLACAVLQGGGFGVAWPYAVRTIVAGAAPDEQSLAASAAPTLQRIGYAVGAALAGIIANASGFGDGLTVETARSVAVRLFAAFIPLALLGLVAAIRLATAATSKPEQAAAANDAA